MADNMNVNGLPPNDVDISQYQLNNPAISDSEHQVTSSMQNVGNPAILDSEFQTLESKAKMNSTGLSVGDEAGINLAMFV
ncbi:MAG: hypothetical protein LBV43_04925 [Prevotella sp.]|jgi:hypothetical protein|nr:hypothetical protein [Prevotella sp.]